MSNENNCGCGCNGNASQKSGQSIYGWMPSGSQAADNPDGSITIVPPSGWTYVGFDVVGTPLSVAAGGVTISCTCKGNGSCLPFAGHGMSGCRQESCSDCNMKASVSVNNIDVEVASGGYVDYSIVPVILTVDDAELPAAFQAMYYDSQVVAVITTFLNSIYLQSPWAVPIREVDGISAPSGHSIALVNICGRATPLVVPQNVVVAGMMAGGSSTCKCTSGACDIGSKAGFSFCKGDCSGTCTLQTRSTSGTTSYNVISYRF